MLYNMKKKPFSVTASPTTMLMQSSMINLSGALPCCHLATVGSGGSTARYCGPLANLLALSSPRLIQPRSAQKPTALQSTQDAPLTHCALCDLGLGAGGPVLAQILWPRLGWVGGLDLGAETSTKRESCRLIALTAHWVIITNK